MRYGVCYLAKKQRFLFGFCVNYSNHLVNIEQYPILNDQLNCITKQSFFSKNIIQSVDIGI